MKEIIKERALFVIKYLTGLALIAWILSGIDVREVFKIFLSFDAPVLMLILVLVFLNLSAQFLRWRYLVERHSQHFRSNDLLPSFFAGFAFRLMIPGGHAEITKIFLLPGKKSGKVMAFGMEKYFETYIKMMLVLIALPFVFTEYRQLLWVLAGLGVIVYFFLPRLLQSNFIRQFQEKTVNYHRVFFNTFIFSMVSFIFLVLQYYVLLNDVYTISIINTFFTVSFTWASGLIPISVSGLGVRENLAVYFLGLYSIPAPASFSIALFIFFLNLVVPALVGLFFIYKRWSQIKEAGGTLKEATVSAYRRYANEKQNRILSNSNVKTINIFNKLTLSIVPINSALKSLTIFKIKYSAKRIFNLLKITSSMIISRIVRKPVVWGYPPLLMIEPTNICNLKCPMCPAVVGKRVLKKGQLQTNHFKRLLDETGDYIFQIQLWNQGEPFINRELLEFVRYAKTKGVMVLTSTNGHFIPDKKTAEDIVKSGLDQLIFSMDGTNQESYEKYRIGGNYETVLDGLREIAQAKQRLESKTPLVELQFIIFKHNQNEIDVLINLAKELKLNRVSFKSAMVYSAEQAETYLDQNQREKIYDIDDENIKRTGKKPDWCKRLWLNPAINWDGAFVPCCFDIDADYVFGNVFDESKTFLQIWKSPEYMTFRKAILQNRSGIEMCSNCTEGMKEPYARIIETG